jgi:hypothetical protein
MGRQMILNCMVASKRVFTILLLVCGTGLLKHVHITSTHHWRSVFYKDWTLYVLIPLVLLAALFATIKVSCINLQRFTSTVIVPTQFTLPPCHLTCPKKFTNETWILYRKSIIIEILHLMSFVFFPPHKFAQQLCLLTAVVERKFPEVVIVLRTRIVRRH